MVYALPITCHMREHYREFSIVRERRHVTPCLSSAPSSTGYCEPVCGQREIGRFTVQDLYVDYTALLWQKEASDKSDISCKRAKCVCHFHWRQWNIMMSYLTYLLAGWVFMHKIWPRRRVQWAKYENINNSNLDGMSLASFCQSRAV